VGYNLTEWDLTLKTTLVEDLPDGPCVEK